MKLRSELSFSVFALVASALLISSTAHTQSRGHEARRAVGPESRGGPARELEAFIAGLPRLYRERLRDHSVTVRETGKDCDVKIGQRQLASNPKTHAVTMQTFVDARVSSGCDLTRIKESIVGELTDEIMKEHQRCAGTDALWNTKDEVLVKKSGESDEALERRDAKNRMKNFADKMAVARKAAVEALVRRTPVVESSDLTARIWFETRMGDDPNALAPLLKPEYRDNKLVMMQTWGLSGFGHATLGFVSDPRVDAESSGYVLNPGSFIWEDDIKIKNKQGQMVSPTTLQLMLGIKDEKGNDINPNEVRALEFWKYVDSKTLSEKFPLQIDARVAEKLSANQKVVLQTLIDRPPYKGSFRMVRNNCAHGARDIYNTLLPLDACPNLPGIAILPKRVLEGYAKVFGAAESFNTPVGQKMQDVWKKQ
jgi:hypothetical protein